MWIISKNTGVAVKSNAVTKYDGRSDMVRAWRGVSKDSMDADVLYIQSNDTDKSAAEVFEELMHALTNKKGVVWIEIGENGEVYTRYA